jgi:hypothetical protein
MECTGDPRGCQALGRHRRHLRHRNSTGQLTKAVLPGDALLTVTRDGGRATVVRERKSAPSGARCASVVLTESATACEVVRTADGELSFTPARTAGG